MRKKEHRGFQVNPKCPAAIAGMLAFALCIPLQIAGYWDRLHEPLVLGTIVIPTVLSAVLMIVVILKYGRDALWLTIFPVCLGVLGFVFKLMIDPNGEGLLHRVSAIVLYFLIVVLWALTVFAIIQTKWPLTLLFLIPFFKHIVVNDLPILLGTAPAQTASAWLKEFCMLSFMLALSLCTLSFERPNPSPS